MSPDDVIELPGAPGQYARRAIVDAWVRAGSPPVNSAGRLYAEQKKAHNDFLSGKGSPADDPDVPTLPLAHVRFVALDITPTPARVAALEAQGLVRPYKHEPWHWQLPGDVRSYPLVTSIPIPVTTTQENEMSLVRIKGKSGARRGGLYLVINKSASFLGDDKGTTANVPEVTDEKVIAEMQKRIKGLG